MITGASSGIGEGLALELSRRGAAVGLVARRAERLNDLVKIIEVAGGKGLALEADVSNLEELRKQAASLRSTFGPIDVLIANAGIGTLSPALDLRTEDVAAVFKVNVLGAVNSVAAVLPEMISRKQGQLVAMSSLSAYRGLSKSAAYCASKAAMSSFFESLRIDLRDSGVDVTIIHPGFIKTPLTTGRVAKLPYLMELDTAVKKIIRAIEKRKKSYAFPWQLAGLVRLGLVMPTFMYDRIAARNSYRE